MALSFRSWNKPFRTLAWASLFVLPAFGHTQTWLATPTSGDWNTSSNWTPASFPNLLSAGVTFNTSSTTSLSLSADANAGNLTFNAAAPSYLINTGSNSLEIGGLGIINNSSYGQTLVAGSGGAINFSGSASGDSADYIINSGGSFDISQLTSAGTTVSSIQGAGDLFLGSKSLTTAGDGVTFSGTISDGGLGGGTGGSLNIDGGIVSLEGDNTFTGGVSILNGNLRVGSDGALGLGNVFNGSVLRAEVGSSTPQTIHVAGNYDQDYFAYIILGLYGPGQCDRLVVDGQASLAGNLELFGGPSFTYSIGDTYDLFSTNGFSSQWVPYISSDPFNAAPIRLAFRNTGTDLLLMVLPVSFEAYALTPNQTALSQVLDANYDNPENIDLIAAIIALPEAQYPQAYHLAAQEEFTSLYRIAFSDLAALSDDVMGRLADVRFGNQTFAPGWYISGSLGGAGLSFYGGKDSSDNWAWDGVLALSGSAAKVAAGPDNAGYDFQTGNITMAGINHHLAKDLVGGGFLGYSRTDANLENAGHVGVDGIRFGAYGTWYSGRIHADALVIAGINYYGTSRQGLGEVLTAKGSGFEFTGLLGGGWDLKLGKLVLSPSANMRFATVELPVLRETSQNYSPQLIVQHENSLMSELAFQAELEFRVGGVKVSPRARAGWRHELQLQRDVLFARFGYDDSSIYQMSGVPIGQDALALNVGFNLNWTERVFTYVEYRAELGRTNIESQGLACGTSFGL